MMTRGAVVNAEIPGAGRHPVVVASRNTAVPILSSLVCVLVTSTFHGHVAEVELGPDEGLHHASAANCDNIFTLSKSILSAPRGHLGPAKLAELDVALGIALGLTGPSHQEVHPMPRGNRPPRASWRE
jgi:mRNA-degrading endonuclease toxin of MazEF toxin-antitoxin module